MKNWKQLGFVCFVVVIVFSFIGCDDPCSHNWNIWVETTPATLNGTPPVETDGVETRTCLICGENETRSVSFRSYFYGIWFNYDAHIEININTNLVTIEQNIFSLILNNPIWSVDSNTDFSTKDDYPVGYRFEGINNAEIKEGQEVDISFFINAEKNKIKMKNASPIFIKQNN